MNQNSWKDFKVAKNRFYTEYKTLADSYSERFAKMYRSSGRTSKKNNAEMPERTVVCNNALKNITQDNIAQIQLILVADNPGREEQKEEVYLSQNGQAGKLARRFFSDNYSELGIDFDTNVLVLNKTPIHTPDTKGLLKFKETGGPLETAFYESQKMMANLLLHFQKALHVPVWIVGYSEMTKGGIFEKYTEKLHDLYAIRDNADLLKHVYVFKHFSRNWFSRDVIALKEKLGGKKLERRLLQEKIGKVYRERYIERYPAKSNSKPSITTSSSISLKSKER